MSDTNKRLFEVTDMEQMIYVSAPTVSNNGKEVVFVKYWTDRDTDKHNSQIYRVSVEGGEVNRVTERAEQEDRPAFSPDGKKLAFLSKGSQVQQIWIIDFEKEAQPTQMTSLRHGVSNFVWSPDSTKIAFETKVWPTDENIFTEMTDEEKAQWDWQQENMPKVTEELMYKFDETYGFVDGSYRQIGVLDVFSSKPLIVTDKTKHADTPAWSHDSQSIAYHNYIYNHDKAKKYEVFITSLQTGETIQVTKDTKFLGWSPVLFTPDNKSIIYSALLEDDSSFVLKLAQKQITGDKITYLFPDDEKCHGISCRWTGKTEYGATNPDFQLCGNHIYFTSSWNGHNHIYRLNINGEPEIEKITQGEISVRTFCAPVDDKLVYVRGDLDNMDEVYCLDLNLGVEKRLTYSNDWLDDVINSRPEEMWVSSKDGETNIHGWIVPPAVVEEGKKYPVVLYIHGGPQVTWTAGWWHELQALAATGHAVVFCDPRGSTGYGREFVKGTYAWGDEPVEDLMGYLDAALAKYPYLDEKRIGVTGGSYGGYMTLKLMGLFGEKFKAAVGQRVLCNPATSYGTGDMGFISSAETKPKSFKDYINHRATRSHLTKIDNMKTPLLILHGMLDYRCSVEQAEQLFVAMKDRNPDTPVRMVLFPGENHDLTRSGKITSQMRHLDELVQWFEKYLSEEE